MFGISAGIIGSASGFNPLDLDPVLYLDAGEGVTESGGLVSRWDSKVGSLFAEQLTGSSQPTLTSSDSNYNNFPSIGGSSDFLELAVNTDMQVADFSAYYVVYLQSGVSNLFWFRSSDSTNFNLFNEVVIYNGTNLNIQTRDGGGAQSANLSLSQGLYVISVRHDAIGSGTSIRKVSANSTILENVSNLNPVSRNANPVGIGSNLVNPSVGFSAAEIIYYNKFISDVDDTEIVDFLKSKYGI